MKMTLILLLLVFLLVPVSEAAITMTVCFDNTVLCAPSNDFGLGITVEASALLSGGGLPSPGIFSATVTTSPLGVGVQAGIGGAALDTGTSGFTSQDLLTIRFDEPFLLQRLIFNDAEAGETGTVYLSQTDVLADTNGISFDLTGGSIALVNRWGNTFFILVDSSTDGYWLGAADITNAPEPASYGLLGVGLLVIGFLRRKAVKF